MSTNIRTRVGALAAAGVLALTMGAAAVGLQPTNAFAEGALVLDSTAADATPAGPGYDLTVSGLENGDTAKYYQIIEQDVDDATATPPHVGTQQWKLSIAVDYDGNGVVDGTEETDFGHKTAGPDGKIGTSDDVSVKGLYVDELYLNSYTVADNKVTSDTRQLTAAMANALATAVTNNQAKDPVNVVPEGELTAAEGKVTVANANPGMYMFVAVPNAKAVATDYVYKPVFVSADYYNTVSPPEDDTHKIALVADSTDYLGDPGVFKRSPLAIDKKSGQFDADGNVIDLQQDVAVGDTIDFSITVPVPTYSKNYVAPMFYITDTLTEGLKLDAKSITVSVKNGDGAEVATADDYRVFVKDAVTGATDYFDFKGTVTETSTFDAFVVQFRNDDFLYRVVGAPTCTITYQATVTETDKQKFAQQVNQMDNTAKLNYSKDPNYIPDGYFDENGNPDDSFDTNDPNTKDEDGEEEPTGELQDKTRHYTFDIDADVLGRDQSGDVGPGGEPLDESDHDKTSEIRKTWIDSNGKVIQSETTGTVVKGGTNQDGKQGEYGWLEGAEFTLTKTQEHVTEGVGTAAFKALETPVAMKFDASTHILKSDGENPKSDAKGYISMKGLDAGVYVLKEIKAPLGYAFNPNVQYTITITPNYILEPGSPSGNPAGNTPEDGKGGADDLILSSYEIKIVAQELDDNLNIVSGGEVETISTYNIAQTDGVPNSILDENGAQDPSVTINTTVESFGNNTTAMIVNKKLGLLPATGGSGILFYLGIGAAIMALAVGLAMLKRRLNNRA